MSVNSEEQLAVEDDSRDAAKRIANKVADREHNRKFDAESLVFLRAKATRLKTGLREKQSRSPDRRKPEKRTSEVQTDVQPAYHNSQSSRLEVRDFLMASEPERCLD